MNIFFYVPAFVFPIKLLLNQFSASPNQLQYCVSGDSCLRMNDVLMLLHDDIQYKSATQRKLHAYSIAGLKKIIFKITICTFKNCDAV